MLTRPWTLLCLLATLTALAVLIPRIIQEASDLVATPPSPALDATTSPDPLAWFCIALVVIAASAIWWATRRRHGGEWRRNHELIRLRAEVSRLTDIINRSNADTAEGVALEPDDLAPAGLQPGLFEQPPFERPR